MPQPQNDSQMEITYADIAGVKVALYRPLLSSGRLYLFKNDIVIKLNRIQIYNISRTSLLFDVIKTRSIATTTCMHRPSLETRNLLRP